MQCIWTDLVGGATFIRPKHDNVGGSVGELFGVECLIVLEEFHICTTTFQTVLCKVSHSCTRKRGDTYSGA